jgi:hypothetical protein
MVALHEFRYRLSLPKNHFHLPSMRGCFNQLSCLWLRSTKRGDPLQRGEACGGSLRCSVSECISSSLSLLWCTHTISQRKRVLVHAQAPPGPSHTSASSNVHTLTCAHTLHHLDRLFPRLFFFKKWMYRRRLDPISEVTNLICF